MGGARGAALRRACSLMPERKPLSHEDFLSLAAAAGIDAGGDHGEELFTFVQNTLAGLESLMDIDVAGAEPDMAFIPPKPPGD